MTAPRRCVALTRARRRCSRRAYWRLSGRLSDLFCFQHGLITGRAGSHRELSRVDGTAIVLVASVPRTRRLGFTVPTTRAEALDALPKLRSLSEWHLVCMAVLDAKPPLVALGARNDVLYQALLAAKNRLRATASEEELRAYVGDGHEVEYSPVAVS